MAVCVFCNGEFPEAQLDFTGKGLRCAACSRKADLNNAVATAQHGELASDLGDHLSRAELLGMMKRGRAEAWTGVGLTLLGAVATAAAFAIGTRHILALCIFVGGLCTIGHGIFVSRQAATALRRHHDEQRKLGR